MRAFMKSFILAVIAAVTFLCSGSSAYVRIGIISAIITDYDNISDGKQLSPKQITEFQSSSKQNMDRLINIVNAGGIEAVPLQDKVSQYMRKSYKEITRRANKKNQYDILGIATRDVCIAEGISYTLILSVSYKKTTYNEVSVSSYYQLKNAINDEELRVFHGIVKAVRASGGRKDSSKLDHAIDCAALQAVQDLYWYLNGTGAMVEGIDGNRITLNIGSSSGVKAGDVFKVQAEKATADPDAQIDFTDIALARVIDVQGNTSIAELLPDAGKLEALRTGDRVIITTSYDAESIIASIAAGNIPSFPQKRESESNALAALLPQSETLSSSELPPGAFRIGVIKFSSKVPALIEREAAAITDMCSRFLSVQGKISVLERDRLAAIMREHRLTISGKIDPETAVHIGRLAGCQYILMGSVTEAEETDIVYGKRLEPIEKVSFIDLANQKVARGNKLNTVDKVLIGLELLNTLAGRNDEQPPDEDYIQDKDDDNIVTETHDITLGIEARLVNVSTSKIEAAFFTEGSASESDILRQDRNGNLKGLDTNSDGIRGKALEAAASVLSGKLREVLLEEYSQIVSIIGGEIIINRGASSGIQEKDLFCVYPESKSPADSEVIINIKDVQEQFSVGEVVSSTTPTYSITLGSRLEPVLHRDFVKGIWHIKNLKRAQYPKLAGIEVSLEELAAKKPRLASNSTDPKRVIHNYGLSSKSETELIAAHMKADKAVNNSKKYEGYKQLSDANNRDYLASYNAAKYAFSLKRIMEAREYAMKSLFINPGYKPAKALVSKIDGEK